MSILLATHLNRVLSVSGSRCFNSSISRAASRTTARQKSLQTAAALLIVALATSLLGSPAVAQLPKRVPLTDPSSLLLPINLHRAGDELDAAPGQLQAAIAAEQDADRRARLRLKLAWVINQQAEIAAYQWDRSADAEHDKEIELAQVKMRTIRAKAIAAAHTSLQEAVNRDTKAAANYRLARLYDSNEQPSKAVPFFQTVLDEYADAKIEWIIGKSDNRFGTLNALTICYANQGKRQLAIDTCLEALSIGPEEKNREYCLYWLLEYEPRLKLWSPRLPEEEAKKLASTIEQPKFVVTFSPPATRLTSTEPIRVKYRIRGQLDHGIESYRSHYRVWKLSGSENDKEERPAFVASGKRREVVHTIGRGMRSWIPPTQTYHLAPWQPLFVTAVEPPGAEIYNLRVIPHFFSTGAFKRGPWPPKKPETILDGTTLDRQGELDLGKLPPGKYMVAVQAVEYQRTFNRGLSNYPFPISVFASCEPLVIEVAASEAAE